jgi:hypothetical protein
MLVYDTNWRGGWVGVGKLSFQCLRPSASLRAAGHKYINNIFLMWDETKT